MKITSKPNIVLIIMDCVRADHLSCYGYERKTTPNIDNIANESVLCENAFTPAVWTLPSIASLFTGTFPSQHGMNLDYQVLNNNLSTLPQILSEHDYNTIGLSSNIYISKDTGFSRGFKTFEEVWFSSIKSFHKKCLSGMTRLYNKLISKHDSGASRINKRVKQFLSQENSNSPFFLYIHYIEPHTPYHPPEPYYTMYLPRGKEKYSKKINQSPYQYYVNRDTMNDEKFYLLNCLYDGAISCLDMIIGHVYKLLFEKNLLDNTLLIITSDHGENVGDHKLLSHQYCVYDTLMHVPLIIKFPKMSHKRKRINYLVQTLDIFHTILDIADVSEKFYKSQSQGRSLLPERMVRENQRDFVIAEYLSPLLKGFSSYQDFDLSRFNRTLRAIRTKESKLIWSSDNNHELYDLNKDSQERNNIFFKERDIAHKLHNELNKWLSSIKHRETEQPKSKIDKEIIKRLQHLGYM